MDTITSVKDPRFQSTREEIAARRVFLAEGCSMVTQALESEAAVETVFVHEKAAESGYDPTREARSRGAEVCTVSRGVFTKLLGLGYETSTRVVASVRIPRESGSVVSGFVPSEDSSRAVCLAGERIQDPRNVGVLVRTADAFGADFAVSADSASPWSRQSVRSSTGSIFRVKCVVAVDLIAELLQCKTHGVAVIGTSAHAPSDVAAAGCTPPCVVVMGNESDGLSEELQRICDRFVSIPMYGTAHSLNVTVAAGIMLHRVSEGSQG